MQLEEYFDFLAPDYIRIKGTRVGIETEPIKVSTIIPSPRGREA